MSSFNWKFWAIPLTLWSLYSCWYFGYQSGYAEGHETAWSLARPYELVHVTGNQGNVPGLYDPTSSP